MTRIRRSPFSGSPSSWAAIPVLALACTASLRVEAEPPANRAAMGASVDAARAAPVAGDDALLGRDAKGANWPAYGRQLDEQRYSPLEQVDRKSVARLGLAWTLELDDVAHVTTVPLAVDGILYFAAGSPGGRGASTSEPPTAG